MADIIKSTIDEHSKNKRRGCLLYKYLMIHTFPQETFQSETSFCSDICRQTYDELVKNYCPICFKNTIDVAYKSKYEYKSMHMKDIENLYYGFRFVYLYKYFCSKECLDKHNSILCYICHNDNMNNSSEKNLEHGNPCCTTCKCETKIKQEIRALHTEEQRKKIYECIKYLQDVSIEHEKKYKQFKLDRDSYEYSSEEFDAFANEAFQEESKIENLHSILCRIEMDPFIYNY